MTALKVKNTQLSEKQKESLLISMKLKKEKDEIALISQQLNSKLSHALAKAEQVPALEIEKKDLDKKIQSITKQLDTSKADADKKEKLV